MKKLKNQGSTLSDSIQNLKIIDLINESNYVVNEQFIDGKSNYIKKLEKIFDVSIETDVIVCGIDTSVLKIKNVFDNFLHFWSPTPIECIKNSISHVIKFDLYNCICWDQILELKYDGFYNTIHKANGKAFYNIDLLITLTRKGVTKYFRVDHPKIIHMFEDGMNLFFSNKYELNQIKEYLNNAFSSNPNDLNSYITKQYIEINKAYM